MHIRELVKQKWQESGLYESQNEKVQAFLKYFDEHSELCWSEVLREFRERYYEGFNDLVPPLLDIDDKLLRLMIVRKADLNQGQEVELLSELVRKADPLKNEPELSAIARRRHTRLTAELQKRQDLTEELRRVVNLQYESQASS